MFTSLRRRRSPSLEAFMAPVDLPYAAVFESLRAVSAELITGKPKTTPFCQTRNSRHLIRKIQVISVLLDAFPDTGFPEISPTLFLCLKELYLLLYRSKILIDYVNGSTKLWLLLQTHSISGHFHDLNQEISTLFDVFPLDVFSSEDLKEQVELLRKQLRKSKLFIDRHDDSLRSNLYRFLNEFQCGRIPERIELHDFFVEKLGIRNAESYRLEIEFLEEQIVSHDSDIDPTASILRGFVALVRYCRYLLFRFEDEGGELGRFNKRITTAKKGLISKEISTPKDLCCPISLDLMRDPVIVSTGQTYDRSSIARWMEDGHCTCPKTGQILVHTKLVQNKALRNLILEWCMAQGIHYDPPENSEYSSECSSSAFPSKAVVEATKAISRLLVEQLENGSQRAKKATAWEIRSLAKTGKWNRACIAEAGAVPLLKTLLSSPEPSAQENSVTALLNLSIHDKNKSRILEADGCLTSIVEVLKNGHTTESRENAAATLFSLSAVHDHKKKIADENGAVEALAGLLKNGTSRGKKDAVTAIFNLCTHTDNCSRMVESGAAAALISSLGRESVSEEAAGALALIFRRPEGAEVAGGEEAVTGLIEMMRCGTPRGKENAVAALLELCRSGGDVATGRVVRVQAVAGLLQSVLFTGTKRARRKAASLARVFRKFERACFSYGGLEMGYPSLDAGFGGDVSMSTVSISVPVL